MTAHPKSARSGFTRVIDTSVQAVSAYAGYLLLGGAWPKLTGAAGAVAGFRQLGAAVGIDPTIFRLGVGASELLVSLALWGAAFAFVGGGDSPLAQAGRWSARLGGGGLVATMMGALATEFLVRPGEQDWLVRLAVQLLAMGTVVTVWALLRFGLPMSTNRNVGGSPSVFRTA